MGTFVNEVASKVKPGQLTPMPTSQHINATFKIGVIESVEYVTAKGKMIPAIEFPFLHADGIAQPM